jgi:hypothetical protein
MFSVYKILMQKDITNLKNISSLNLVLSMYVQQIAYIYTHHTHNGIFSVVLYLSAQSIQSAKHFLQSSELGLPPPPEPQASVFPHPLLRGARAHSLAGEGLGESQFRRGERNCGALYI